jgi:hypothetical protein
MRAFMQQHLGDEWEIWLVLAGAIASPDASIEQLAAAHHRAVAIVGDLSPNWTLDDVGELIADARSRLWPHGPGAWERLAP